MDGSWTGRSSRPEEASIPLRAQTELSHRSLECLPWSSCGNRARPGKSGCTVSWSLQSCLGAAASEPWSPVPWPLLAGSRGICLGSACLSGPSAALHPRGWAGLTVAGSLADRCLDTMVPVAPSPPIALSPQGLHPRRPRATALGLPRGGEAGGGTGWDAYSLSQVREAGRPRWARASAG